MTGPDLLRLPAHGVAVDPADPTHLELAAELARGGIGAFWVEGGRLDRLDRLGALLEATGTAYVGTAAVMPDEHPADALSAYVGSLPGAQRQRLVVGLAAPHGPQALAGLGRYLDALDRAGAVPADRRLVAALGPRKLGVAGRRSAGALTLLAGPDFVPTARASLGTGAVVVDQPVVLDGTPDRARETARGTLRFLLGVPGYRRHLGAQGFPDAELDALTDRLVDHTVAWGGVDAVAARVRAQRAAGADHVFLAPLIRPDGPGAVETLRALVGALLR